MFVRYRKIANDGTCPWWKERGMGKAVRLCEGTCKKRRRWFTGARGGTGLSLDPFGCPHSPRCRWRVESSAGLLEPYRLKVVLVDNRRVGGIVRQETVAVLGSIDAIWLDSFWPNEADKGKLWATWAPEHRADFWASVESNLRRLDNRLGDAADAIRAGIAERIGKG
jgi:hypothetical protein